MEILIGILFSLAIPILIIVGIVYLILKIKSGITIAVSFRFMLRAYFYIAILVSIGLAGLGGLSTLINVALGEVVDREFSYGNVYEDHRAMQERSMNTDNGDEYDEDVAVDGYGNVYVTSSDGGMGKVVKLTPEGKEDESFAPDVSFANSEDVAVDGYGYVYVLDRGKVVKLTPEGKEDESFAPDFSFANSDTERSLPEKVELEMKGSLISGISLTLIGAFLLVVHFFGRILVETKDERTDVLRRLYLIIGLGIFAIVTVISLASAVPETLRYALLDVRPGDESPGEALAISIVALPVWVCYLVATLRNVRRISDSSETIN